MPQIKLLKKRIVANGTMEFYFQKPKGFHFKAGQYLDYTVIHPSQTDSEGNIRSFTIASAPFEKEIVLTTRMRDTAFKDVLKILPLGSPVSIQGPKGRFVLHKDVSQPAVFLIGGIGITPARAMILQATHDKLPYQFFLFYSNRHLKDTAFLPELRKLEKKNKKLSLIPTMTDYKKINRVWKGEIGHINRQMLEKYIPDLKSPVYYLSGPPHFVEAMQKLLKKIGVTKKAIRLDEFSGY